HAGEVISEGELPILYAGVSQSFRKEAGAHGKDTKGIFRVHHFSKVEQFVFAHPDTSWEWHERLIRNAEELWQGLGLPYRVVNIASGDLGVVAAKKYDIEAWMPAQGKFREMVSCSNCTDWQSYRLNIRYAETRGAPSKGYVHTLNSTALAIQRTITAIVENNQREDGRVILPRVLRKYLDHVEHKLRVFAFE
ncbi:MAG: serine--tRNA ligase, partial [Thermofilum sp.]